MLGIGDKDVHAQDAGHQGHGQHDYRDQREDLDLLIDAVGAEAGEGRVEAFDNLLLLLEHIPEPVEAVDQVAEVLLFIEAQIGALAPGQQAHDGDVGLEDAAQGDDVAPQVGELLDGAVGVAAKHLLLGGVELLVEAVEHREAVVNQRVDDAVEQKARAAPEQQLAAALVGGSLGETAHGA